MKDKQILLFDGVCIMCNNLVKFLIKRDKTARFKFAQLQSEQIHTILNNHTLPPMDYNPFMYLKDGSIYFKSTAILHVFKDLGGIWQILYGFIIIPKFFRDFVYNNFAKRRYKILGKYDACPLPAPEISDRFIL